MAGVRRMARRWRFGACTAVIVVVVAACGSNASSHPNPSTSTSTDVTAIPPTDPSSSSTTTAVSPRDQVIAAHHAYESVYTACQANPAGCDTSAVVIAGSPAAAGVASVMAQLAKDGLRGRSSPQTYYVYEDFSLGNTGTQAVLRICTVDADVTYDPHGGPQGQQVIVNDRVDSDLGDWTFRRDGASWKLYVSTVITQWKGTNGCPPRPPA